MPISVNIGGVAEIMLIKVLETGGGGCGSPRWHYALAFVAANSRVDLCSRDRVLRIDWHMWR